MSEHETDATQDADADTVVLAYAPATDRIREQLTQRSYRGYLRRSKSGPVAVGEEWAEFVSCGCGTTEDVVLRVENVQGGAGIGEETTFEFEPGDSD